MTEPRSPHQPLRVCYVLGYYDPNYVRTRTLTAALRLSETVELTEIRNTSTDWRLYLETIARLLRWRRANEADVYILGFRGHELYWPVRLITRGRPLVFDAFLSPSDVLLRESKHGRASRLAGRLLRPVEAKILRNAAHVLSDTESHADFFCDSFGLGRERITAIPVGADPVPARVPQARNADRPLRLLYYGSALPLHGLDILMAALAQLGDLRLDVRLIGGTPETIATLGRETTIGSAIAIEHAEWVDFDEIFASEIPIADLSIGGPFGSTPQAGRVITGKTYQFLAGCRATLVGDTTEHRESGFRDHINCLMAPQGEPAALASAIRWADANRDRLPEIGMAGRDLYDSSFSTARISEQLVPLLHSLAPR